MIRIGKYEIRFQWPVSIRKPQVWRFGQFAGSNWPPTDLGRAASQVFVSGEVMFALDCDGGKPLTGSLK